MEEAEAHERQVEEAKRDMSLEEFKEQFMAHIEGTAPNEREAHDSAGEEGDDQKKSQKQGTVSKKGSQLNRTNSQFAGDGDSVDKRNEGMSKRSSKRSNLDTTKFDSITAKAGGENFKNEVPDNCSVSMMKKCLIDKLPAKYFLASHPFPKIEGEMIVFRPRKQD